MTPDQTGEKNLNPYDLQQQELERQKEVVGRIIDELQSTLFDPLSANFPGLAIDDHPFSLPDQDKQEWTFTPFFTKGSPQISNLLIEGAVEKPFQGRPGETVLIKGKIFLSRNSGWPLSESSSLLGYGTTDEKLAFLAEKVDEVLAPIKEAQELTARAYPRWAIDPQTGSRFLRTLSDGEGSFAQYPRPQATGAEDGYQ